MINIFLDVISAFIYPIPRRKEIMTYKFNPEDTATILKRFLTGSLLKSGLGGFVIGLSGGIDSALSAALAVNAVGPEKLLGVLMPYRSSSQSSVNDALELADKFGIKTKTVNISPMIDSYYESIDDSNRLRAGNKMARERMSILFDISHELGYLVLGTGNRTEIALGYTTWYGDSACSLNPLAQLYKTEVRELSKYLGVPDSIISKPPSADLWSGQTDESEIGVTYEAIDQLLEMILDQGVTSMSKLKETGSTDTDISRVVSLINLNSFKRNLPATVSLGRENVPDTIQLEE